MISFTVGLSEVEGRFRLDPDYYQPKYRNVTAPLQNICSSRILDECIVTLGPAYSSKSFGGNGNIRIAKIGDITNKRLPDAWENISAREFNKFGSVKLDKDDILLTMTGDPPDVGKVFIPYNSFEEDNLLAFNQRVARIKAKKIDQHYLYAYLSTEKFRLRIEQVALGIRQRNISVPDMRSTYVFVPKDTRHIDEITRLIKRHLKSRQESQNHLLDANSMLEFELRLDNFTFEMPIGYSANFSELETSLRSDAQHYQPRFKKLINHLSCYQTSSVRDIRAYNRRGLQPIYVDNGEVDVINSQHLGPKHIDYSGLQKTSSASFSAALVAHIRRDDLLIYTTGAYVGRTNIYLSDAPAMASNHVNILRLRPGIDAAYMALVFQSIIGQFQTQKHARGSAQAELYPNDIDRFIVPLIDEAKQKEIGDLLRESLVKQQESKRLLEQAKTRVEQLIEEAAQS